MKKLWFQKYEQKSKRDRGCKIPQSKYSQKVFPSVGHFCCEKPGIKKDMSMGMFSGGNMSLLQGVDFSSG